jgi:hypothetical protein
MNKMKSYKEFLTEASTKIKNAIMLVNLISEFDYGTLENDGGNWTSYNDSNNPLWVFNIEKNKYRVYNTDSKETKYFKTPNEVIKYMDNYEYQ